MLPEGHYRARAIDGGLGMTAEGNPQVAVRFGLLDEEFVSEEITWFGSFSKNQGGGKRTPFERTIESLRNCGWQGDDLSDLVGICDQEVILVVEHEEYRGKVSARVKWVNRPGGLALKAPMSPERAKAFAAKMKGDVMVASRSAAAPSRPPSSTSPKTPSSSFDPPSGDDLPF